MSQNITITGLNFEAAPFRNRITEKLERIYRHADGITSTRITLSAEKQANKAAAQVHLAGKDLHLEVVENDMGAAIDVLIDKLDHALVQYKEKRRSVR